MKSIGFKLLESKCPLLCYRELQGDYFWKPYKMKKVLRASHSNLAKSTININSYWEKNLGFTMPKKAEKKLALNCKCLFKFAAIYMPQVLTV